MGVLSAVLLLAASNTGTVEPRIEQGPRLREPCRVAALSEAGEEVEGDGRLELPPGAHHLLLRCRDVSGSSILVPGPTVEVRPGQVLKPRIEASAAPLRIEATRNGDRAEAKLRFRLPEHDAVVLEAVAGATTWIGRGPWRVEVALVEAPASIDLPIRKWKPGRKVTTVRADLSDGKLVVRPTHNGRRADATVRVTRLADGATPPPFDGGETVPLLPGRYRVETSLRAATDLSTHVEVVDVAAGDLTRLDAPFAMGQVSFQLVRDGATLKIPLQLTRPGAARPFGFVDTPGEAVLAPGRYALHVEGRMAGPTGRWPLPELEVKAKSRQRLRYDLSPAVVELEVEGPSDASVVLRQAGGGEDVPPSGGVYRCWAGRYEVAVAIDGREVMVDGPFEVALGQTVKRAIEVPVHTLSLQATAEGQPAPGAVLRVYRPGAGRPVGTLKGSGRLELTSGTYDVRGSLEGRTLWLRGIDVSADRTLTVEIPAPTVDAEDLPSGDGELPEGDAE